MISTQEGSSGAARLWPIVRADLYRWRGKADLRTFISAYLHDPGFRFTYYLRKVAYYSRRKKTWGFFGYIYNRIMLNHYRFRYGMEVSAQTMIGPGLFLNHFGGIVISPFAILGSNINIGHGATIGAESRGKRKGAPTLEDRVWVGAHAIIVGKITIGTEALIAPGAFVNFDVPAKSVVLGNPGKVVSNAGSAGYINRVLDDSQTAK